MSYYLLKLDDDSYVTIYCTDETANRIMATCRVFLKRVKYV